MMTRMLRTFAFALVLLPLVASAETQLTGADAGAFMGSWTLNLDSPQGNFEQTLVLKEEAGKVVGETMNDDRQRRLVDEFLREAESAPAGGGNT